MGEILSLFCLQYPTHMEILSALSSKYFLYLQIGNVTTSHHLCYCVCPSCSFLRCCSHSLTGLLLSVLSLTARRTLLTPLLKILPTASNLKVKAKVFTTAHKAEHKLTLHDLLVISLDYFLSLSYAS